MPSRLPKPLTSLLLASLLALILLLAPILGLPPAHTEASEAGSLQIPDSLAAQLGYNHSRIWSENTPIDQVLMLGDLQDAFGLQTFNLATIAQLTGLNLNGISLTNFPLVAQQTLASLVDAIPQLAQRTLNQVPILKDLVNLNLHNLCSSGLTDLALQSLYLDDFGSSPLSELASNELLGQLSLGDLNLSQYSFSDIPDQSWRQFYRQTER
ncbi:MAG: hypothetical protein AAGD09_25730 [Cyanobacteria bacterium P01_F01_bin.56]